MVGFGPVDITHIDLITASVKTTVMASDTDMFTCQAPECSSTKVAKRLFPSHLNKSWTEAINDSEQITGPFLNASLSICTQPKNNQLSVQSNIYPSRTHSANTKPVYLSIYERQQHYPTRSFTKHTGAPIKYIFWDKYTVYLFQTFWCFYHTQWEQSWILE